MARRIVRPAAPTTPAAPATPAASAEPGRPRRGVWDDGLGAYVPVTVFPESKRATEAELELGSARIHLDRAVEEVERQIDLGAFGETVRKAQALVEPQVERFLRAGGTLTERDHRARERYEDSGEKLSAAFRARKRQP